MQLSKRLAAVAAMIEPGSVVADVGTDHGYLPIFLIQQRLAKRAIALDINEGPLLRAKEHIVACGLEERISLRLSDGVDKLEKNEADTLVIAGMGGNVMIHILETGQELAAAMKQCIFQPQSDLAKFRKYLREHHFKTVKENMVFEDGKYYPMMCTVYSSEGCAENEEQAELFDRYGRLLLEEKNPVLKIFIQKEIEKKLQIMKELKKNVHRESTRDLELRQEISYARQAMNYFL